MSGHTPGPWTENWCRVFAGTRCLAHIRQHDVIEATDEERANAKLMAAAPETAADRARLREVNAELVKALKWYRHETVIIGWQTAMVDGVLAKATEDRA